MVDVKLNKKQAQEFAKTIFADIESYVNEHLDEYKAFLVEEGGEDDEMCSETA